MLDKAKNKGEPKPYLRNLNVRWFGFDLSDLLTMRFTADEEERYTLRKGDLVICEGGYPGRAAIWDREEPVYFQKALHRVRFHEPGLAKWCMYFLLSEDLSGRLRKNFNGAGIQHFTGEALARFEIPVPSPNEVRRIVAVLDEAFEGIAAIKVSVEKSLLNAQKAFERSLASVFAVNGQTVELSEIALSISDGDHSPPPKTSAGVPFITISNIVKDIRRVDFDGTFCVSHEYFSALKAHRRPRRGDVLYTVTGSFGIPVLVDDDTEFCFQRHIGLIRPSANVNSRWLTYALLSPTAFAQAEAGATGTAQRTLSLGVLRKLKLPRVSLEAQTQIASRLDALSAAVQSLKTIQRRKLAALDELKQSLLHQAFHCAL